MKPIKPRYKMNIVRGGMEFLYDYDYCIDLKLKTNFGDFREAVECLTNNDLTKEFEKARKNHLTERGFNSSKAIADPMASINVSTEPASCKWTFSGVVL